MKECLTPIIERCGYSPFDSPLVVPETPYFRYLFVVWVGSELQLSQPVQHSRLLRHALLHSSGPSHELPGVHHANAQHTRASLRVRQRDAYEPRVQQERDAGVCEYRCDMETEVVDEARGHG